LNVPPDVALGREAASGVPIRERDASAGEIEVGHGWNATRL
jgi:hypothetical protein